MRSISARWLLAIFIFTALGRPYAQSRPRAADYPRFEVIDLGTFGGPNGNASAGAISLSPDGAVTAAADTSQNVSCTQHPINFWETSNCFALHAFRWKRRKLTDLGTLGGDDSFGFWINNRDDIAGVAEDGTFDTEAGFFNQRAALWRDDSITDLGSFGGPQSFAFAINSQGQVSGAANTSVPDPFSLFAIFFPTDKETHAFLWDYGVLQDLGTLGGPDAMGLYLNDRGEVAGVSFTDYSVKSNLGTPAVHGFVWRKGRMFDIGTFGGDYSYVNFFNNRGQAVGFANLLGDATNHAFLWDRGRLLDLGTLGGTSSTATWVSKAGQVVGQANLKGDKQFHAFSWYRGHMHDLGTLVGDGCSFATNNNSSGEVVGISEDCGLQAVHGFYLKGNGPMVDIDSLIVGGPLVTPIQPVYISDRGEIVEFAAFPNGEIRTVLLRPTRNRRGDGKIHRSMMSTTERAHIAARIRSRSWGLRRLQSPSKRN